MAAINRIRSTVKAAMTEEYKIIAETEYSVLYEIPGEDESKVLKVYKGAPNLIEIDILSRIRHPNIIPILEVVEKGGKLGAVMPLADMNLTEYLKEERSFEAKLNIFYKIVCAVDFLLDQNILPFDLHSGNVVMMGDEPLIIDTGLARRVDCRGEEIVLASRFSAMGYRLLPIENMLGSSLYSEKSIAWSLGILLYNMFAGKDTVYPQEEAKRKGLFEVEDNVEQWYEDNLSTREKVFSTFSRRLAGLAAGIFESDLKKRYTIPDILRHPIFAGKEEAYPMGTVITGDYVLHPSIDEDIIELLEAMTIDIARMKDDFGEDAPSVPSSIIFGAMYIYQQYLSHYGQDEQTLDVSLQIAYNIYGIPLLGYNPIVDKLVLDTKGILHPITDYKKAFTKLAVIFPELGELDISSCPKPSLEKIAVMILG